MKLAINKLTVVLLGLVAGPLGCPAQEAREFKIQYLRENLRPPPIYNAGNEDLGGYSPAAQRPWLQIDTVFQSRPDWADNITLKFYVLIGRGNQARMFTAEETYLNVKHGPQHFGGVFLPPNVLDRYGAGHVDAVAVQMFYQDRLVDQASEPHSNARWWEQYTPITGVLRGPRDTPWAPVAYLHYEETARHVNAP